jgi:hypothetical protein
MHPVEVARGGPQPGTGDQLRTSVDRVRCPGSAGNARGRPGADRSTPPVTVPSPRGWARSRRRRASSSPTGCPGPTKGVRNSGPGGPTTRDFATVAGSGATMAGLDSLSRVARPWSASELATARSAVAPGDRPGSGMDMARSRRGTGRLASDPGRVRCGRAVGPGPNSRRASALEGASPRRGPAAPPRIRILRGAAEFAAGPAAPTASNPSRVQEVPGPWLGAVRGELPAMPVSPFAPVSSSDNSARYGPVPTDPLRR